MDEPSPELAPTTGEFLTALNQEQKRLAKLCWPIILIYGVVITGFYIFLDVYAPVSRGGYVLASILNMALGYVLLVLAMQKGGHLASGKKSGFGTYFVLGLVKGIAVGLALMVLILPGLYLMMRWLPAYARALTTTDWVGNSLRWSWNATGPYTKPLSIALLGPAACFGIIALLISLLGTASWTGFILVSALENLGISIFYIWITLFGVASFVTLLSFGADSEKLTQTQNPA